MTDKEAKIDWRLVLRIYMEHVVGMEGIHFLRGGDGEEFFKRLPEDWRDEVAASIGEWFEPEPGES